jgi:hypothetical protein
VVSKYSNPTSAQYRRKPLRSTRDNTLGADWFDEYDSFVELSRNLGLTGTRGALVGKVVEDVDQMVFRLREKTFAQGAAIEVLRALEREDRDYPYSGGPIRSYLIWSLSRFNGSVPLRDLDLSDRLEDESSALGYLLLLDEYGVGKIVGPN